MRRVNVLFCDHDENDRRHLETIICSKWEKLYPEEPLDFNSCSDLVGGPPTYPAKSLPEVGQYDVLLLDIQGPEGDHDHGVTLAKMVREAYPELPIVVVSQHVTLEDFQALIPLGIAGYLDKRLRSPGKTWCEHLHNSLERAYEDRSGRALYKQIREVAALPGSWEAEDVSQAASAVWRQVRNHDKWNAFWQSWSVKLARESHWRIFDRIARSGGENDLLTLGALPSLRGHLQHVINVYFLGYVISHKIACLRDSVFRATRRLLSDHDEGRHADDWDLFQYSWLACAAFHDTAYSLEVLPEMREKCNEIAQFYDVTGDYTKIPIKKQVTCSWESETGREAKDAYEFILAKLYPKVSKSWICESSAFSYGDGKGRINHGVASGALFVREAQKTGNIPEDELAFTRWAATAMALHSLKRARPAGVTLEMMKDPLSTLLLLCDEFQVWNRGRPDEARRRAGFARTDLSHLEISDNSIDCTIRYIPHRDVKLDHDEHIKPLLGRIEADQKLLSGYVKTSPVTVTIRSEIQDFDDQLPVIKLQ